MFLFLHEKKTTTENKKKTPLPLYNSTIGIQSKTKIV